MAPSGPAGPAKQADCRKAFDGTEENNKLADLLEQTHTNCGCEQHSVGAGSPGPVMDHEALHRIIVSPRDVDHDGFVAAAPFHKVFSNGLSVVRDCASNDDVKRLVGDGLWTRPGQHLSCVRLALTAKTEEIRAANDDGNRLFCVYDQTVPRTFAPHEHVPTHAGIFLRYPPPKTEDRKKLQKDYAWQLRDIFLQGVRNPADLFDGVLAELTEQAGSGAFVLPAKPTEGVEALQNGATRTWLGWFWNWLKSFVF